MKYPTLDKNHKYLGHFRGCLAEGHNTNEMPAETTMKKAVKGGLPPKTDEPKKPETKQTPPGGVRG